MSESFPASFSCNNNFYLSHTSLGFSGKSIVELHEAMIAVGLSNSTIDLSPGLFRPIFLLTKFFSPANSRTFVIL